MTTKKINYDCSTKEGKKNYMVRWRKLKNLQDPTYNSTRCQKFRKKQPGYNLEYYYNITIEEYNKMLNDQKCVCAICHNKETALAPSGKPFRLAIDHDHSNGKVRGLLCFRCNTLLGRYEENINNLVKADHCDEAKYLIKYGDNK